MEEREEVERAVRAALDSGLSRHVGGVLAAFAELEETTDVPYLRDEIVAVDVRHLDAVLVDGDRAVANLDATLHVTATFTRTGGPASWDALANGPVELARADGEWRVCDLAISGSRVSTTHVVGSLAAGSSKDGAVTASLEAMVGGRRGTTMVVDVANESDTVVGLQRAAAGVRRRRGLGWRWAFADHAAGEVEPGRTRITVASTVTGARRGRDVRLLLVSDRGAVDVRPERARPKRGLPLAVRAPTLVWGTVALLATLAAGLLTTWSIAGVVLFTVATPAALQLLSSPGLVRRFPMFALVWGGATVTGLALFLWPTLFPAPTMDASQSGRRLTALLEERGVRLGPAQRQSPATLSAAWAAFEEFSGIHVDKSLGDVYYLQVGGDTHGKGLVLAFVRQMYTRSTDVWTTALRVHVPAGPSDTILASTVVTPCDGRDGCALRCSFDRKPGIDGPCRLQRGRVANAPALSGAFASSFETGGTSPSAQRESWARFVAQSYVLRRIGSLPAGTLSFDVTASETE